MAEKLAALMTGTVGAVTIAARWRTYRQAFDILQDSAGVAGAAVTLLMAAYLLLPPLKVAAAVWLASSAGRARSFAIAVLSADVLLIALSIFRFFSYSRAVPAGAPAVGPGMAVVRVQSLWPVWAVGVTSIVALAVLVVSAAGERAGAEGAGR